MSAYVVHPSFTDGSEKGKNNHFMNGEWDKEIPGYWVAKYAAGFQECTQTVSSDGTIIEPTINIANVKYSDKYYTSYYEEFKVNALSQDFSNTAYSNQKLSYPVFKPLTYAYNMISTGDAYTISQEIAKASNFYGLNSNKTDSHQMKNSEWGAVAYLTQSIYGRNGVEVTANKQNLNNLNSKLIYAVTGYSGKTPNGVSASSTNNMSGIFDLGGCVWEHVSAYISNGSISINNYGASYANLNVNENGYKNWNTKYVTVYPYDLTDTGSNYGNLKSTVYGFGDAILETSYRANNTNSWNKEYSNYMVRSCTIFESWF